MRRRRSRAEAEQLVAEFETSGLTRAAFCAGRGLSVAALDKYRRRHRERASGGSRMIPVEVSPSKGRMGDLAVESRGGLWLELPNGCRIAVGSGFEGATLKRLLAVLAER